MDYRRYLVCLVYSLGLVAVASARDVRPGTARGWLIERWGIDDGLPLAHVEDVLRAPDGLTWLGTFDGLVSFDGGEFRVFRRGADPRLPTSRLYDVEIARDGAVWAVGEPNWLIRVHGGEIRSWQLPRVPPNTRVTLHRAGERLVATSDDVFDLEPEGPRAWKATLLPGLKSVTGDPTGGVWVHTRRQYLLHSDAARRLYETVLEDVATAAPFGQMTYAGHELFIGTATGLHRHRPGTGAVRRLAGGHPVSVDPICALEQRADAILVRTTKRWWRQDVGPHVPPGEQPSFVSWDAAPEHAVRCGDLRHVVSDEAVWEVSHAQLRRNGVVLAHSLPETRQLWAVSGELWLATVGEGVLRVRQPPIRTLGPEDGLPASNVESVLAVDDGIVATLGAKGLARLPIAGDSPFVPIALPALTGPADVPASHSVYPPMRAEGGAIDVPLTKGWCRRTLGTDRCELLAEAASAQGAAQRCVTSDGVTWTARAHLGLERHAPGTPARTVTRDIGDVRTLLCLPDGSALLGTRGAGLVRVDASGQLTRLDRDAGLPTSAIRAMLLLPSGQLLFGTDDAGLCRVDVAEFPSGARCVGRAAGIADDTINGLAVDALGRTWMAHNQGLSVVTQSALDTVFDTGEAPLLLTLSERDGLTDRETNGYAQPSLAVDGAGRLYVATQKGVATVSPDSVAPPKAPAVRLASVSSNGNALNPGGAPIELSSDASELAVTWAATEYEHPDDIRYRYRLGDAPWSRPSRERQARWTHVPPGTHRLEVQAGLGSWGPALGLDITRPPRFAETRWFPALAALLGTGLAALGFVAWSTRHRRRQRELESLVVQRTRALEAHGVTLERQASELALQARRLEEVDALKTQFVANLSHELKTPMSLISGPLEDLSVALSSRAPQLAPRLEVVRRNADYLRQLIEQLLDVARLDAGRFPLRARRLDLGEALARVVARFQVGGSVRVLLDAPDTPVDVFADPDLLEKVVMNLVANATKFSPEGGRVTVRLVAPAPGASSVCVQVADEGIGIAPENQPRLFERFFQVSHGDGRAFEGTGIGLALVREFIELHGGEVGVESRPGLGSTFWFRLPLGAAHLLPHEIDVARAVQAPAPLPGPALEGEPTILVVEDNSDMRAYFAEHLSALGRVIQAADGRDGLDRVREHSPALVVSDVMMPGVDGLSMCKAIRALPGAPPRTILVSAKAGPSDRAEGLDVADVYITKPFRMREVVEVAARLLARPTPTLFRPPGQPQSAPGAGAHDGPAPGPEPRDPLEALGPLRVHGLSDSNDTPRSAAVPVATGAPEPERSTDAARAADTPEPDPRGDIVEESASNRRFLELAHVAIHKNLANGEFGVAELSKAVALSPRQLQRRCRLATGQGPLELIRSIRLSSAREMLLNGARATVAEVAADVGMSPSYFSRSYSAWFGRAPSEEISQAPSQPESLRGNRLRPPAERDREGARR